MLALTSVIAQCCFTTYKGGCDAKEATEFMEKRFVLGRMRAMRRAHPYCFHRFRSMNKNPERLIYLHLTCATDTENAQKVFNTVQEDIIRSILKKNDLL